ncbi:hypothetical protein [Pseudonocardia sp. KRD291]|uniref:hypothetical protein n=1 Tax=Pseudonocardia sp. KRD291 TaxID=2792007 RepID=UPI001C4A1845|nr:hypothetical protein [Pseudonocardia sp. KRD291]MBW0102904.1 hypothetical protein [Pseudonocardia sp. KRD291]
MRLGRKLAEGFAVDHEADRADSGRTAPAREPVAPLAAAPDVLDTDRPEPVRAGHARTGPRTED